MNRWKLSVLLIILILALIAVNCSGNKKSDIYNAIDFRSIDPGTLAKGKEVYIIKEEDSFSNRIAIVCMVIPEIRRLHNLEVRLL